MIYCVSYILLVIGISGLQLILEEYYSIAGFLMSDYHCYVGCNSKDLLVVDLVRYLNRSIYFIQNYWYCIYELINAEYRMNQWFLQDRLNRQTASGRRYEQPMMLSVHRLYNR